MMSVNRGKREDPTEITTNSALFSFIGGALNHDSETVEKHTLQIESLRKEIEEREKTLSRLKQDFNDLRAQNDDLQITLESKKHEIDALKEKVAKLETEKKTLETKLQNVELEYEDLKSQNDQKNKEIADLKISLEMKDKEITAIKREVKDLKDQNNERYKEIQCSKKEINDLTISLKLKDKEIIALKREVTDLKDHNEKLKISLEASNKERDDLKNAIRGLQNVLKSLKLSTETLKKESEDAKEERKKSEEDNNKLKQKVQKQSKLIERITKERDLKDEENNKWKKELEEKVQVLQSYGRRGGLSLPDPVDKACIVLGQMCSRVQAIMYQKVFPDSYVEDFSYTVKFIEEDIGRIEGDTQRQAIERYKKLKKELSWDEINHPRTLKEIKKKRNNVAHPSRLTKEILLESAKVMQEARELRGRMSLDRVHEMINIWDHLTKMG